MRHYIILVLLLVPALGWWGPSTGWHFKRSLPVGAKAHGHQKVSAPDHPVRYGNDSERFEVRPGDCSANKGGWDDCRNNRERSELKQISPTQHPGDEYWYRWSIFLPKGHKNIYPVKVGYGQFHQKTKRCKVAFMFQEYGGGYHLSVQRVIAGRNDIRRLLSEDQFTGKWNDIVVHARWSRHDDGFFKVWANGEQKVDYRGRTMTCADVYFKYGIYRSFISRNPLQAGKVSTVVYYDGVVRSRSGDGMFDPLPE